ncbi:MAG: M42 family metallopeptidase [Kosmotoga sp.]|nr:MAG: M42 family metallopeptidase [Kosmotoga sp.]
MKFKRLKKLTELYGISGFEESVAKFIENEIQDMADNYWKDEVGNLIAHKKGKKSDKGRLMLLAHMDEVGLMVKKINKDGTLAITNIGGVDPRVIMGKKVKIGEDLKDGVIGYKAIHEQKKEEILKTPKYDNLCVYAGYEKEDDAKSEFNIGDPVFFDTKYKEVGDSAIGKAFDDRNGCEVLIKIIEYLQENPVDYDVFFAWVVQEEVGLRGSGVAASQIEPDSAIVFEGTTAGDNPELAESRWAARIGHGPVLTYAHGGLVPDRKIFEVIKETAKNHNIPHQFKGRTAGGTDAARLARSLRGIPAGVISTSARYIHSPTCLMRLNDFENTIKLGQTLITEGKVLNK